MSTMSCLMITLSHVRYIQVHKRAINDAASTHWVDLCRQRAIVAWIQSTRGAKDKAAKKLIALHYFFSQNTGTLCANCPQKNNDLK